MRQSDIHSSLWRAVRWEMLVARLGVFVATIAAFAALPSPVDAEAPVGLIREIRIHSNVSDITAGPEGDLWFTTNLRQNAIGRIAPGGKVMKFKPLAKGVEPGGIVTGPDGNVWFTYDRNGFGFSGGGVGRISPKGGVTLFPEPPGLNGSPFEIIAGPDGNLWFDHAAILTPTGQAIGRITRVVKSASSAPGSPRAPPLRTSPLVRTGMSGSATTRNTRRLGESRRPVRSPSSGASRRGSFRSSKGRRRDPIATSGSAPTSRRPRSNGSRRRGRSRGSLRVSIGTPNMSARSSPDRTETSGSGSKRAPPGADVTEMQAPRRSAASLRAARSANSATAYDRCPCSRARTS